MESESLNEYTVRVNRYPENPFIFNNINVILGANGSGKSSTLSEIKIIAAQSFPNKTVIYVEGGRTIRLPLSLKLNAGNIQQYSTERDIETKHKNKKVGTLTDRIFEGLMLLEIKGQRIRDKHSDDVDTWQKGDQALPVPIREEVPFDKLNILFNSVFPNMKLKFNQQDKTLQCIKGNLPPYPAVKMSDGEKQVLSILVDISLLAEPNSLILVDEPELNLNPLLAVRLWESIENDLPESVFVYTTHDVGFAMRPNVQNIYVLSNDAQKITNIKNIGEIDPEVLRNLLGSIPAILSSNRALITEGKPDSFDALFYKWILNAIDTVIVPMSSGFDVVAVSNRTGVWDAIAPSVSLTGIIDRDFKSDSTLNFLSSKSTVILAYHEVESYFCIPEIVRTVTEKMGLVEQVPSIEFIQNIIRNDFEQDKLKTIAKRVFDKTTIRLSVSIERHILDKISSEIDLESKILEETRKQLKYATETLDDNIIKALIQEEVTIWQNALTSNDIDAMLKLTPGKSLLSKLVKITGAKNISDYSRACTKHIQISDFPKLVELRQEINQHQSIQQDIYRVVKVSQTFGGNE